MAARTGLPADERLVSLGRSGPGFRSGFLETPRPRFGGVFLASAQTVSQSAVPGASTPRVRCRSEAVNIDHGQLVGRRLKDCPVAWTCTNSPQSIGGPRAGETGGGSSGGPADTNNPPLTLTGSPFHQQIATRPATTSCTRESWPSRARLIPPVPFLNSPLACRDGALIQPASRSGPYLPSTRPLVRANC
jgi:hypothetical protein